MKPLKWVDQPTSSEAFLGFIRFYVWLQGKNWVFSFAGRKSDPKYRSREAAKLAGLRFAKKFMVEAIGLIEQSEGYSDPPKRSPKRPGSEADEQAEQEWTASLFTAGVKEHP